MQTRSLSMIAAASLAAMLAFPAPDAAAQASPPAAARCDGVQQDKAACQREAGAAKQEAGRGGLTSPAPSSQEANALARCQNVAAADKADCEARVQGGGAGSSSSSGSVMGGGVVRETVTPVPAPAPAK